MSETDLKRACWTFLTMKGCTVWIQNQGAVGGTYANGKRRFVKFTHGVEGISDIVGVMPSGRFIAVETKMKGNKPTELQAAFIQRVKASGGLALVIYSLDQLMQEWDALTPTTGLVQMDV